jgi:hypothetical protein
VWVKSRLKRIWEYPLNICMVSLQFFVIMTPKLVHFIDILSVRSWSNFVLIKGNINKNFLSCWRFLCFWLFLFLLMILVWLLFGRRRQWNEALCMRSVRVLSLSVYLLLLVLMSILSWLFVYLLCRCWSLCWGNSASS